MLFYKMDKGGPGYHQTGAGRLRISARHVRLEPFCSARVFPPEDTGALLLQPVMNNGGTRLTFFVVRLFSSARPRLFVVSSFRATRYLVCSHGAI